MAEILTDALTRRRLGGAVLVLVGVVVAMIVLWPSTDDRKPAAQKLPVRFVSVPPLGLGFAHPTTWKRTVSKRVIVLRSPDRSIVMFFASPVAKPAVELVKDEAEHQLAEQFAPMTKVNDGRQRLGLRDVRSFEFRGREKGKAVRGLVLVDSTQYRTYAVTVLTAAKPSGARLREAREITQTVRFSKPKALPSKK
ncbi:MAG TPA: hypothetical protein VMY78_11605 [Solirubrobacteraceae bacterium]|nr:hypothetical protein [Solirubrobacteraceae bacterium]